VRCTRTVSQGEEVEGECWFMQGKLPAKYSQGPGRLKISDGRPALKSTRSPNRAHRLQQEAALTLSGLLDHHQVFNSHSAGRNGSEECVSTHCLASLSGSVITQNSL